MTNEAETLEAILAICALNGRVSPMPQAWSRLFGILKGTRQLPNGAWEPPLPLILAAWDETSASEKRARFKLRVEWAAEQRQMGEVGLFLRALPEDQWLHEEQA